MYGMVITPEIIRFLLREGRRSNEANESRRNGLFWGEKRFLISGSIGESCIMFVMISTRLDDLLYEECKRDAQKDV